MGFLSAAICTPIILLGVSLGSPLILSFAGLSVTGPIAGGLFASSQGVAIMSGSWYAAAQTIAMIGMSPTP
jgi:hypothetical protein